MKERFLSLFRHLITYASGFGGWVVGKGLAESGDAAQLSADAAKVIEGAGGILAVILARLVLWALAKYWPALSPKAAQAIAIGFFMSYATLALTSCQALNDYQVAGGATYRFSDGSKAGIACADGKCVPFGKVARYDEAGKLIGYGEIRVDRKSTK